MADKAAIDFVMRNRNDYFAMIGRFDGAALKSAYRKLALKIHPDKNSDPRAADAIKLVNEAYETLKDPKKRSVYERHGAEGARRNDATGSPHQQGRGGGRGHYAEEDIFSFFQQAAGGGQRRGGHQRHGHAQEFEFNGNMLMMLPFIFFILMAMLVQSASVGGDEGSARTSRSRQQQQQQQYNSPSGKLFGLKEEGAYRVKRETQLDQYPDLAIRYFVDRHFADNVRYRRINLRSVEMEVLKEHKAYLRRLCLSEQVGKRKERPSCSRLEAYKNFG
jgi:DnaJ family protein B protein 12